MSAQILKHKLSDHERLQMLEHQCQVNEVSPDVTLKLRNTERLVDRIFIIDNSSSMDDPEVDLQPGMSLFDEVERKWAVLYGLFQVLLTLSSCIDRSGVKVYFLNPIPGFPVDPVTGGTVLISAGKDIDLSYIPDEEIDPYFNANEGVPCGHTPIREVYEHAVNHEFTQLDGSKKLYVTIITDGEPTARDGTTNKENEKFKKCLTAMQHTHKGRLYTQIISVTKEERVIEYLKSLDGIEGVDTTPDFTTMKNEVQHARGKGFVFNKGMYYGKCLLGPMDQSLDDINKWHLFKK
jgi:hypothetical protein